MKIAFVGAFDRYNYGDLIMPLLFQKQLELNNKKIKFNIDYYGLISSNLEDVGGLKTKPLSLLYKNNYDAIIIVGGAVLSVSWTSMFLNIQKNKIIILFTKILNKFFSSTCNSICKNLLNGKTKKPWILDKKKLKTKLLIYNTVGGCITEDDLYSKNCIKNFDYISLRDKYSYNQLNFTNNSYLYPDSVISLSKYFDIEYIENKVSNNIKNQFQNKDYIVFQVNKNIGKKNLNNIVKELKKICKYKKIVLLPIGFAQGHEDGIILNIIHKKINDSNCVFISKCNIYDIIYLIKNSVLFVGTSLHGLITSISYGIPHIPFTNFISKQVEFLETWKTTPIIYTDVEKLNYNIKKILNNYNLYKKIVLEKKEELINLVDENFKIINKLLVSNNEKE